jgi:hypothetical protein
MPRHLPFSFFTFTLNKNKCVVFFIIQYLKKKMLKGSCPKLPCHIFASYSLLGSNENQRKQLRLKFATKVTACPAWVWNALDTFSSDIKH